MNIKITDNVAKIMRSIDALVDKDVLVGIPSSEAEREKGDPVNNAMVGYISEFGSPANNIPARPSLMPGIRNVKDKISERMVAAAKAALSGEMATVDRQLNAAGLIAQSSVRAMINSNIQPALKASTIAARKRRKITRTNTLIDTAQFRNAVTYVIRNK